MALIQCSECNKEISDQAISCPGCGSPIALRRPAARVGKQWEAIGTIMVIGGMLTAIIADTPGSVIGGIVAFIGLGVFVVGRFK
jgi:DNA-directed RNA polymerase subunit RPC12/RpoP